MAAEDSGDMLKTVDWKTVGNTGTGTGTGTGTATSVNSTVPVTKKRLPKKMRQVPDYYFIPRLSWPKTIGIYGTCIMAGIGAGMLGEIWIKKKIKEDGGVLFEMK